MLNKQKKSDFTQHIWMTLLKRKIAFSGKISQWVLLVYENECPHLANTIKLIVMGLSCYILPFGVYSPELSSSDYHLMPTMFQFLVYSLVPNNLKILKKKNSWIHQVKTGIGLLWLNLTEIWCKFRENNLMFNEWCYTFKFH